MNFSVRSVRNSSASASLYARVAQLLILGINSFHPKKGNPYNRYINPLRIFIQGHLLKQCIVLRKIPSKLQQISIVWFLKMENLMTPIYGPYIYIYIYTYHMHQSMALPPKKLTPLLTEKNPVSIQRIQLVYRLPTGDCLLPILDPGPWSKSLDLILFPSPDIKPAFLVYIISKYVCIHMYITRICYDCYVCILFNPSLMHCLSDCEFFWLNQSPFL